jgi:hypothetical protein
MGMTWSRIGTWLAVYCVVQAVNGCAYDAAQPALSEGAGDPSAQEDSLLREAEGVFGRGAQGLADVLNRALDERGPPSGYIRGEEGAGAVGVGLRYGRGTLYMQSGESSQVYWRGPSVGIDVGGSATKVFILVYGVPTVDTLFGRFGGVEGSVFYVGGAGMTYHRKDDIVLAPVRLGVGWRQGVNVGYLHLSPERVWFPF